MREGCSSTVFLCWDWVSGWTGLGDLKIYSLNICPYHFRRVLAVCLIKESKILHLWSYNDLLFYLCELKGNVIGACSQLFPTTVHQQHNHSYHTCILSLTFFQIDERKTKNSSICFFQITLNPQWYLHSMWERYKEEDSKYGLWCLVLCWFHHLLAVLISKSCCNR